MNALIVYESMYGNTRAIAEAIAEGLGNATVRPAYDAAVATAQADLVVAGGPTHMHGIATALSRRMAAEAVKEDGEGTLEPDATAERGMRTWLSGLPKAKGAKAAAFDTRGDGRPVLTGSAARGIARRLRQRGYEVLGSESFVVEDSEGPLAEGELDRARAWGAELAAQLSG